MEELRHRITAKATKIKQFQYNRNFNTNQVRFFKNLKGKSATTKPPDAKKATKYWKGICSTSVAQRQDAEWIDRIRENMTFERQNAVRITKDEVTRKLNQCQIGKEEDLIRSKDFG